MTASLIDPEVLAELQAEAGADFVAELVGTFGEEAPQMIGELRQALARADTAAFRRAAHSIKSNSRTFGATRLAEAARALELGALPDAAAVIDALQAELARTLEALRELTQE